MRVLMINYEYPPVGGGTANANHYFIRELAKHPEVAVDLVTVHPGPGTRVADAFARPSSSTGSHFSGTWNAS